MLQALQRLLDAGTRLRPVFVEIGEYLTQSTEQPFVDQVDREGSASTASTIKSPPRCRPIEMLHQFLARQTYPRLMRAFGRDPEHALRVRSKGLAYDPLVDVFH